MTVRPFVDFYRKHAISPVAQDISDFPMHVERRASLYRLLGIPPTAVTGKDLIEFGPGSGYNAVATARFGPRSYVFVDGNPTGIAHLKNLIARYAPGLDYRAETAYIDEYHSDERYDLVICEGVIPFQFDPPYFARRVAEFAKPGGVVSLTTVDPASFLGDFGRRVLADKLVPVSLSTSERVAALMPYFATDTATLSGMSRPLEDYIYDNIVQPLPGRMFSIADALAALDDDFDFYGSSPAIVTDLRWFKRLHGAARMTNARAAVAYRSNVINLLDSRIEVAPHDPERGDRILALAATFVAAMHAFEAGDGATTADIATPVEGIARLVEDIVPSTAASLDALAAAIADDHLTSFPGEPVRSFFGRGMQYVSFARRWPELSAWTPSPSA